MKCVAENVRSIQENIASICTRVGRKPKDVTIVAVTKTFPREKIIEATQANIFDIGESFVQ